MRRLKTPSGAASGKGLDAAQMRRLEGDNPASWPKTGKTLPSSEMMPIPVPRTSSWQSLRRAAVGGLIISLISATTAEAEGMIRDAETEGLIKAYAKPIFNAAGLGGQAIEIHIINDRAFNAFVVDGHNMFIHAGALMDAKTPNQIIGVIAHESGHITGGHLARLRGQISKARSAALMLQILGLAAMAAGAAVGAGNLGQLGMGAAYGGTDAAMRRCLPTGRTRNPGRPGRRHLPQRHQAIRSWPA